MRSTVRILFCLLALLMAISLVACGDNTPAETDPPEVPIKESLADKIEHITIADAIEIAKQAGQTPTTETYTIVGTVVTVSNAMYGEMTVADETGELYIYGAMGADGTYYDAMTEKPVKGDEIALTGVLMTYNDEPQMAAKNQKAVIVDWIHSEVEIDPSEYTDMSVADARNAAKGKKVKVDGVVAAITYANGQKPCGVILVDEGASIYVYSGDLAQQVSVGNEIVIAATKTYWVLGTEEKNAATFGYEGACQLEDALLISNDKGDHDFEKSWIRNITVKDLLEKDFSENITTNLYKTTALIEKKQGTGFVNYYIRDLDGVTGSYTYTQCNGADFAWLDAYDGKICEVYLTALNAKSEPSGCFYRFLPIAVKEVTNFTYPEADVPAFAIKYGVLDLFGEMVFGSDPAIKLPNTYKNELIGVENVSISYSVSNQTVATLEANGEETVLHLDEKGTCEVTIKATYGSHSATSKVTVTLDPAKEIETPTVAEIIALEDGTNVQIRGVVISSLVNRDGFYLGDGTGMIAVLTTGDVLAKIKPGDEVVIEGCKVHFKKEYASTAYAGQCAIVGSVEITRDADGKITAMSYKNDSKLLANYFGEHDYDTSYFISGKTIDELYALPIEEDFTTNIYTLKAKVVVEGNQYYSNILLQDENGANKLRLYCSSANQYSWLKNYEGQVVDLELAVCNWNDKNYYTGCVISVTVDGQKTINELNFNK